MESRAGAWHRASVPQVPAPLLSFISKLIPGQNSQRVHGPEAHSLCAHGLDDLAACTHPGVGYRAWQKSLLSVAGARARAPGVQQLPAHDQVLATQKSQFHFEGDAEK